LPVDEVKNVHHEEHAQDVVGIKARLRQRPAR
jgi:hypothetical protein